MRRADGAAGAEGIPTLTAYGTGTWATHSPAETYGLGQAVGRSLVGGLTIGLVGPLGAGKTQLVKGVAVGNGMAQGDKVTSPTFTLIHEYTGRLALYHLDAYRLRGAADLRALGFEELIGPGAAVVVEWADRAADAMPEDSLWVEVSITGDAARSFLFRPTGPTSNLCLESLKTGAGELLC